MYEQLYSTPYKPLAYCVLSQLKKIMIRYQDLS